MIKNRTMALWVVVLWLLLLMGCDSNPIDAPLENENGVNYQIVTIEGMPCLTVKSTTKDGWAVLSITCDWSKWSGDE